MVDWDPAGFVVPQLEVFARVDLRLECWYGRCRRCRQCGLVAGLTCRCIIFRKMLELAVGDVGVVSRSLGNACGIVRVVPE